MTEYPFNHTELNACMVFVADILGVLKESKSVQIAYIVKISSNSIYCRCFRNLYIKKDTVKRSPNNEMTKYSFSHYEKMHGCYGLQTY